MERLTKRQAEALEWLPTVRKATPLTLKRHGFSERTLHALAQRGLVDRRWVSTRSSGFMVYLAKEDPDGTR